MMKDKTNPMNLNVGQLIEKIGPINNQLRQSKGFKRISFMWDVGDILFKSGIKRIHPIAWEIQGKSYITRALLSYCYRIRKKWPSKQELKRLFQNVKSYGAFREALPLIENEKFILSENKVNEIIRILNHEDPRLVKSKLVSMKRHYINIKNDRRQRLWEVQEEVHFFKKFNQYLSNLIESENEAGLEQIRKDIGDEALLKISQICMAVANDNYRGPTEINIEKGLKVFKEFSNKIFPLSLANKEKKARFRRLISSENIVESADILNSIRLGEPTCSIKKRLRINTRL